MLVEEAETEKDVGKFHLNSHVLYDSVDEDVMLMPEALDFFIKNSTDLPVPRCIVLGGCDPRVDRQYGSSQSFMAVKLQAMNVCQGL